MGGERRVQHAHHLVCVTWPRVRRRDPGYVVSCPHFAPGCWSCHWDWRWARSCSAPETGRQAIHLIQVIATQIILWLRWLELSDFWPWWCLFPSLRNEPCSLLLLREANPFRYSFLVCHVDECTKLFCCRNCFWVHVVHGSLEGAQTYTAPQHRGDRISGGLRVPPHEGVWVVLDCQSSIGEKLAKHLRPRKQASTSRRNHKEWFC